MIRSVISDLGKVLITFDNSIFYRKIAVYSPIPVEEIPEIVNVYSDVGRAIDTGMLSPQGFYERVKEILQVELSFEEFAAIYNDVFASNTPVIKVMGKLKNKYRLVMLSNTDLLRFGFIREKFPEVMIFDDYVLSYQVGCVKPDPRIYQLALQKAQAGPKECVFIDDRPENIAAAEDLGIRTILFLDDTDLEAELNSFGLSF
ncbi:MAG: HAD-IA family hydrolase [Candidatus Aminicenantes bacterium]|nr:HAD-IA family hydrolase [Candidatus Aminicenantes bacterium]